MTIEIQNPELESILRNRLRTGNFTNIEEMLLDIFRAVKPLSQEDEGGAIALEAAARIKELRKGVTLDRPAGVSLREYAHIGHRY